MKALFPPCLRHQLYVFLMITLLAVPIAVADSTSQALSYQFGATAANAGGQAAVAIRYRRDRLLVAGFTAPRSAPSVTTDRGQVGGRYGLLAGYRPLSVGLSSWLELYSEISAGVSIVHGGLYTTSDSADKQSPHPAPSLEALWGMRLGLVRVDIASHVYFDPQAVRPWSFPLWIGGVITW